MVVAVRRALFIVIFLVATWISACAKDESAEQPTNPVSPVALEEKKAQIQWLDFDDGLARARTTRKPIMINFYTDWCVYCKKFERETLRNPQVVEMLEGGFIAVRLNAENETGRLSYRGKSFSHAEFSRYFGVTAFPSIAFLNNKGEPITVVPGFVPAPQFSAFLNYIRQECYLKRVSFEDFVAKGNCG
ncbi:MAG TPA: thioredoxin fold domain-containing protein [Syntrophobacteria bacterium]|nr:thioredoxin fold domain-containing protein [Syntrophobacteria bacterium]